MQTTAHNMNTRAACFLQVQGISELAFTIIASRYQLLQVQLLHIMLPIWRARLEQAYHNNSTPTHAYFHMHPLTHYIQRVLLSCSCLTPRSPTTAMLSVPPACLWRLRYGQRHSSSQATQYNGVLQRLMMAAAATICWQVLAAAAIISHCGTPLSLSDMAAAAANSVMS